MSKGKIPRKKSETVLIVMLLISLALFTCWQLSGAALFLRIRDLKEQRAFQIEERAVLSLILSQKTSIDKAWSIGQSDQIRLNRAVPDLADMPVVLSELEKLLNHYSGGVQLFSTGEPVDHYLHSELFLALSITGSAGEIMSLLHKLESFPHLLIIDNMTWALAENELNTLNLGFRLICLNSLKAEY